MKLVNCKSCLSKNVCYKYKYIQEGKKEYSEYFDKDVSCEDYKNKDLYLKLPDYKNL